MKRLVFAEKPGLVGTFGKAPGAAEVHDRDSGGNRCITVRCLSHSSEYAPPDSHDGNYPEQNFEGLPIIRKEWIPEIRKDKKEQFNGPEKLFLGKNIEYVVKANDAAWGECR